MAADERNMPFIKNLASSDRKIRTSALSTLRTFLAAPATAARLTELDHLKLWKGLFYSLWMCDRPVPQQSLCAELAALVGVLPTAAAGNAPDDDDAVAVAVAPFLRAFWATLAREWTAIDVLRMEKFLLLVRRVLGASLAWAADPLPPPPPAKSRRKQQQQPRPRPRPWAGPRAAATLRLLAEWPLDAAGDLARVPVGLRLHVLDIWVDEVERLGLLHPAARQDDDTDADADADDDDGRAEFVDGLRRLVEVHTRSACKPVRRRAQDSLADDRLPWNRREARDGDVGMVEAGEASNGGESWDGFED
ncbi:hypothetical protein GGS23DRAFT_85381 [Durotheca rogersii]|uniref:uncharacterized protein n=1 Tax=Durotheca rogersii TaxID=419775 RepID=UPI00221EBAD3|nr:uncharacterized protein GGS23DRAFT_85381 [Durotheca rogersii]KAI5862637.1 hypothetical protein GGS23DRAFT_85381 [Durotheca rogersii]